MYYSTEHVCRLIFLFLFLLCLMYNFVFIATTQLHSNKKQQQHKQKDQCTQIAQFSRSYILIYVFIVSVVVVTV